MTRSARKRRSVRGEYCELASCSTTIVIENTSAVNEIIDVVIADNNARAPAGPPPNSSP